MPNIVMRSTLFPVSFILALFAQTTLADSAVYVDDDAPAGGDGITWDSAYRFLQDALVLAADPDNGVCEIRIAQGTYKPDRDEKDPDGTGDRFASFQLVNGIAVVGGYAGLGQPDPDERDPAIYETILSGDLLGDDEPDFQNNEENSLHVLTAIDLDQTVTLDGLVTRGGNANGQADVDERGGGLHTRHSDIDLIDCVFTANETSVAGGAIYNDAGTLSMVRCAFTTNNTWHDFGPAGAIFSGWGGGLTLHDCSFRFNTSGGPGGAICCFQSDFRATDCVFQANECDSGGGGMIAEEGVLELTRCRFIDNSATFNGGGVYSLDCNPIVEHCTFVGNHSGVGGGAVIVNGGETSLFTGCLFDDNSAASVGAGLQYSISSDASVIDCAFIDNFVSGGAGGAIGTFATDLVLENGKFIRNCARGAGGALGIGSNSSLIATRCNFVDNEVFVPGGSDGEGGAITLNVSNALLMNCRFDGNHTNFRAGAIYSIQAELTIVDCTFVENSAGGRDGGALYLRMSDTHVFNSRFLANVADEEGGAVFLFDTNVHFTNCLFANNQADDKGGAIADWESDVTLTNCTVAANIADLGAGFYSLNGEGELAVTNCIFWDNTDSEGATDFAQFFNQEEDANAVNYSLVQGLTKELGGIGNIDVDPLFVDPDGADDDPETFDDNNYRLTQSSPANDAGFNNAMPIDSLDLDADDDLEEFISIDLDGKPRFADVPRASDVGCGVPVIVDMGAYETLGGAIQPLRGDMDGDLEIGVVDLLLLLGNWGPCDGCCLADLDADWTVGPTDLQILLNNWG